MLGGHVPKIEDSLVPGNVGMASVIWFPTQMTKATVERARHQLLVNVRHRYYSSCDLKIQLNYDLHM